MFPFGSVMVVGMSMLACSLVVNSIFLALEAAGLLDAKQKGE